MKACLRIVKVCDSYIMFVGDIMEGINGPQLQLFQFPDRFLCFAYRLNNVRSGLESRK